MNASPGHLRQDRRGADARDAAVAAHHGLDRTFRTRAGYAPGSGHRLRPRARAASAAQSSARAHCQQCRLQDVDASTSAASAQPTPQAKCCVRGSRAPVARGPGPAASFESASPLTRVPGTRITAAATDQAPRAAPPGLVDAGVSRAAVIATSRRAPAVQAAARGSHPPRVHSRRGAGARQFPGTPRSCRAVGALELPQHGGSEYVGPYLFLEELGHQGPIRKQVWLREMPSLDQPELAQQPARERRHAVTDHHRSLDAGAFECRGTGSDQRRRRWPPITSCARPSTRRTWTPAASRARRLRTRRAPQGWPSRRRKTPSPGRARASQAMVRRKRQAKTTDLPTCGCPESTASTDAPRAAELHARLVRRSPSDLVRQRVPHEHRANAVLA